VIQPGIKIGRAGGQLGTLGTFALHKSGRVVLIGAEHTITNHWRACLGDPLILEPIDSKGQTHSKPSGLSLRIKGIREDLPAVLKKPVDPALGMKVVKFGWRTRRTVGRVVGVDSSVLVPYGDGYARTLRNLIEVEIDANHGDSGALLLSEGNYRPIGFLEARHKDNNHLNYFIKARTIAQKNNLLGFYCPMELPLDCPDDFVVVANSMVPDGYFGQVDGCMNKDWKRMAKTVGMCIPGFEEIEPFDVSESEAERQMEVGQKARYVGRLVVDDRNRVISLVFAGSDDASIGVHLSKIREAFGLKLIGVFGW